MHDEIIECEKMFFNGDYCSCPYEIEYSNRLKKEHMKKQGQAYEEAEREDKENEYIV